MQTSNKILSAGLGLYTVVILGSMLFFYKNMNITRLDKSYVGNGIEKTVELTDLLLSDTLVLADDYNYVLDPKSTKISVTSDANLVDDIKLSNRNKLRFYREGNINFEPSDFTRINIGIQNKAKLVLILSDNADLKCNSILATDLKILADDNTRIDLEVNGNRLEFELEDRANLFVSGEAEFMSVHGEDNVLVKAKELELSKLEIRLSDMAMVNAMGAAIVDIYLEDKAILNFDHYWNWTEGPVKIEDRARFKIGDSLYKPKKVIKGNGN